MGLRDSPPSHSSDPPRERLIGRIALACCLCVSALLVVPPLWRRPQAEAERGGDAAAATVSRPPAAGTRPIEAIRVGQRVRARNPEQPPGAGWPEPAWDEWLHLKLELPLAVLDGDSAAASPRIRIELLRPREWLRRQLAASGERGGRGNGIAEGQGDVPGLADLVGCGVRLEMSEMGVSGLARITGAEAAPAIEGGPGHVVTGIFAHPPSRRVIDVALEGEPEPIGVTENHRFWSEDRREFVAIGRMATGERLRTIHGETKRIVGRFPRPGPRTVHNLEVYGRHVYHVGHQGILTHNAYAVGRGRCVWRT